jgi:hypothetical protein
LKSCYALGTACGQACGYVSSSTKHCVDGTLDPILLSGLTTKRVQIKTSVGGGGAAEALVSCSEAPCKEGLHFNDVYVEAENPADFLVDQTVAADASHGGYYVTMFAMTDSKPQKGEKPAFIPDMDIKDHITHVQGHHVGGVDAIQHTGIIRHPKPTAKPEAKKRDCVDLPGVRLDQLKHSRLGEIPKEYLVKRIQPRRSATMRSWKARAFFHLFIFFMMLANISTILSKFPGNCTDFYPMYTWDEIRTHGYVMEKFGCTVSCGCSAAEAKMFIFRNWVGKIASGCRIEN